MIKVLSCIPGSPHAAAKPTYDTLGQRRDWAAPRRGIQTQVYVRRRPQSLPPIGAVSPGGPRLPPSLMAIWSLWPLCEPWTPAGSHSCCKKLTSAAQVLTFWRACPPLHVSGWVSWTTISIPWHVDGLSSGRGQKRRYRVVCPFKRNRREEREGSGSQLTLPHLDWLSLASQPQLTPLLFCDIVWFDHRSKMPYVFKRLLSPPLYPQLLALPLLPKSEPVRGSFLGALFSVGGGTDAYNSGERPTAKGSEFYFSFSHTDVCTCACVCVCMWVYTPINI